MRAIIYSIILTASFIYVVIKLMNDKNSSVFISHGSFATGKINAKRMLD